MTQENQGEQKIETYRVDVRCSNCDYGHWPKLASREIPKGTKANPPWMCPICQTMNLQKV